MTLSQSRAPARSVGAGRNPPWEESPNAPGVLCTLQQPGQPDSENATAPRGNQDGYDEIDRRLLDTFPASDAVARY